MIVDTSAIMAILLAEPESVAISAALRDAARARMSAGTFVELGVTASRRDSPIPTAMLDLILAKGRVVIEPVTHEQALVARNAYLRFGKGFHPARLNFGDCFAYALAKTTGEPLLFKGDDFAQTDVVRAL
ncbi:type II toxin-antitoxin system VapC family toxin [Methyloraptor flagellatus]|jgi:ribonuclease VapC|uniref:Ribonuclease VapC n=1 Tax=Methyloraptor flagellatus TaxID=3162530 RepID=A0AAU7X6F7_9HYPH